MATRQAFTNILRILRSRLVILLSIANGYVLVILIILSTLSPESTNVTAWLYDDHYVLENSLRYYVDFRPGYPPLGKLPLYFIYSYTRGSNLAILSYNVFTFNLSLIVLYYLVKDLMKNRKLILKAVALYVFNPASIIAILQPHADFLALSFTLMGIHSLLKKRFLTTAILAALGFATKIYPVFILIPTIIAANNRERVKLITVFALTVWLLSLPFLIQDPFMYLSTFIHHFYRGPSESIFAILDGYYGHTGFIHPLFDAAIYYFQFSEVYNPSHDQHFYYAWRSPSLRYVAPLIQLTGFIPLCLYIVRNWLRRDSVNNEIFFYLFILAFFTYLSLSPMQNILVHLPAYVLACILLAPSRNKLSILTLILYAVVNGLHAVCWNLLYQYIELVLFIISNLRVLIVVLIYLSTLNKLEELKA